MKTKTETLTDLETDSLKKELHSNYLTSFIIFLMITFLVHLFSLFKYDKWIIPNYEILMLVLLIATFYLITFLITRPLRSEIRKGQKFIESRIIINKYVIVDTLHKYSSEVNNYVIATDTEKFLVTEDQFKNAEKNDLLVVHKTPLREMELKIELKKA